MRKPFVTPAVNRAQTAVRWLLWPLPVGFVVLSGAGLLWLGSRGFLMNGWNGGIVIFWLILNIAFVVSSGWFYGMLACSARGESDVLYRAFQFCFFQMFLIPLLLIFLFYLAVNTGKIGWP